MKNLKCPYCGKKLTYVGSIIERKQGEHTCSRCGRNSTIFYVKANKVTIVFTILIALALFIFWFNTSGRNDILGIVYVFIPFLIYFFLVPFFIRLVPIKSKENVKKKKSEEEYKYSSKENAGSTKIIPNMGLSTSQQLSMSNYSTKIMPSVKNEEDEEEYTDISKYIN